MFHHMLYCTMTHKNWVSLVIKDYKLIEEFPDSDFFGPYKVKKSKLSGRICFKENSRTLKKPFRHYQPPSSSDYPKITHCVCAFKIGVRLKIHTS